MQSRAEFKRIPPKSALISQYDMLTLSGRDYHFYITDASGDGRIVEYDLEKEDRPTVATPIRTITNYFGMHENKVISGQENGAYGTGKDRRDRIESEIARAGENTSGQTAWAALKAASTAPDPESIISNTQWSIVCRLTDLSHEFVLHRRWAQTFAFRNLFERTGSARGTDPDGVTGPLNESFLYRLPDLTDEPIPRRQRPLLRPAVSQVFRRQRPRFRSAISPFFRR